MLSYRNFVVNTSIAIHCSNKIYDMVFFAMRSIIEGSAVGDIIDYIGYMD